MGILLTIQQIAQFVLAGITTAQQVVGAVQRGKVQIDGVAETATIEELDAAINAAVEAIRQAGDEAAARIEARHS